MRVEMMPETSSPRRCLRLAGSFLRINMPRVILGGATTAAAKYADIVGEYARANELCRSSAASNVNVQPHSGSQATPQPTRRFCRRAIPSWPRPGAWRPPYPRPPLELQRKLYRPTFYQVRRDTELIDYDELEAIAERRSRKHYRRGQRLPTAVGLCPHGADC